MGLFVDDPQPFALGQSVIWLYKTQRGIVPMVAKVANVINERVLLRVVKKTGEVYFKVVSFDQLKINSKSDECNVY